ncbi:hypothetical protein IKD67_01885 [Candidatus Saccharibacteria bacterium]|nr:hypothetical protein [Candidatus Saccharibacteria bacterium]
MAEECSLYRAIKEDPIASKELEVVFQNNWGITADVDSTCLVCGGDPYEKLAQIIPKNRTIYDFGAAYGFQSFWFRNHKKYIGISPGTERPFRTKNSEWYDMTAQEFLSNYSIVEDSFVICNYVPDDEAEALIRLKCPHLFVNYVTHGDISSMFKKEEE